MGGKILKKEDIVVGKNHNGIAVYEQEEDNSGKIKVVSLFDLCVREPFIVRIKKIKNDDE